MLIGLPIGIFFLLLLSCGCRWCRPGASSRVMPAPPPTVEAGNTKAAAGGARVSRQRSSFLGNAAAFTGAAALASLRKVQARARGAIARQHVGDIKQRQHQEQLQLAAVILIQANGRGLIARSAHDSAYRTLRARQKWRRAGKQMRYLAPPSRRPPPLPVGASSKRLASTGRIVCDRATITPSRDAPVVATLSEGASSQQKASTSSLRRGSVAPPSRSAPVMEASSSLFATVNASEDHRDRRRTVEAMQRPPRRCTVGASGAVARAARARQEEVEGLSPRAGPAGGRG